MSKLYLLTGAQKTTLESWTSYTETALPQALTSITPGDYHLYRVSDVASGTVIAAQSVPTLFSSSYGAIGINAYSLAIPTHATDDILVWIVIQRGSAPVQDLSASGFTTIVNSAPSTSSTYTRVLVYAKRAASGSETAPSMTSPGGARSGSWMVIRGCATAGAVTDAVKVVGSNATSTYGLPDTTLAAANGVADDKSLILMVVGTNQGPDLGSLLTGPFVNAAFTSITTRNEAGGTGTNIQGRYLATAEKAVAGSISSSTAPIANVAHSTATLSFKPA